MQVLQFINYQNIIPTTILPEQTLQLTYNLLNRREKFTFRRRRSAETLNRFTWRYPIL